MRLRADGRACGAARVVLAALVAAAVGAAGAQDRGEPAAPTPAPTIAHGARPTRAAIEQARDHVAADPAIDTQRIVQTLRWIEQPPREARDAAGWLVWIERLKTFLAGFFRWIAGSARAVVWVAAALLAALVVVYVARLLRSHRGGPRPAHDEAPTKVLDLDITPESLPPDVGAAAAALWTGGEQRAALALLYRALLSRLVHVYGVPIRDSSTEGDVLALAGPRLQPSRAAYMQRLIGVWQSAVYGGRSAELATALELCNEFAAALDLDQTPAARGTP